MAINSQKLRVNIRETHRHPLRYHMTNKNFGTKKKLINLQLSIKEIRIFNQAFAMKQLLLALTATLLIVGCSKNTQLQTPLASSLCLIEGLVVNEDGAPVPDIHIIQSQQSKYHPGRPPRTSEDGRFFDDRAFLDRLYDIRPLGVEKNWKDSIKT